MRSLLSLFTAAALMVGATSTAQAEDRVVCVYDPGGRSGAAWLLAQEMAVEATAQGVKLELRPYTDEATAASDLTARKCDASVITGVRTRQFKLRTYSLEAIGGLNDYAQLSTTVKLLADERLAGRLRSGDFETAAVFPAGSVYLYVRDRSWTNKADLAGRKIATLSFDPAARTMVEHVGASVVSADIGTFANMFNNGQVDVCYAPATAYEPLELYRGLGTKGGIIRFPLSQLTLQLIIRHDRFPDGFGQWARKWSAGRFDSAMKNVRASEGKVDAKYWQDIPAADKPMYDEMFGDVRQQLQDKGVYDAFILGLLRRVRCQHDATRPECIK